MISSKNLGGDRSMNNTVTPVLQLIGKYLEKLTIGLSFEPCLCSTLSMSTVHSCTNFLESPIFDPCVRYPTPITIIHLLRLATSFLGLELLDKGQLISKGLFGVFKSTKRNNEMVARISALASKRRSNNKTRTKGV